MKDVHNKAAEHHESAAKSRRSAADSHGKNDHAKADEHSTQAEHAGFGHRMAPTPGKRSCQR
jgi:hypothetical protein